MKSVSRISTVVGAACTAALATVTLSGFAGTDDVDDLSAVTQAEVLEAQEVVDEFVADNTQPAVTAEWGSDAYLAQVDDLYSYWNAVPWDAVYAAQGAELLDYGVEMQVADDGVPVAVTWADVDPAGSDVDLLVSSPQQAVETNYAAAGAPEAAAGWVKVSEWWYYSHDTVGTLQGRFENHVALSVYGLTIGKPGVGNACSPANQLASTPVRSHTPGTFSYITASISASSQYSFQQRYEGGSYSTSYCVNI